MPTAAPTPVPAVIGSQSYHSAGQNIASSTPLIGLCIAVGIVVVVVIIGIMSSVAGGSNNLVGKWEGISVTATFFGETRTEELSPGEAFWEINSDGTGAVIKGRGTGREEFNWHTERGRLYMTHPTGESFSVGYNISGSTLIITMDEFLVDQGQSVVMTLRRVQGSDNRDLSNPPGNGAPQGRGSTPASDFAEDLIGRWEGVSADIGFIDYLSPGELFWEFKPDGTGVATEGRFRDNFTWHTEGNRFYMTEPSFGVPMHGEYSISGSTLTIRVTDGVTQTVWTFRSV
jgi:hypothetical protein